HPRGSRTSTGSRSAQGSTTSPTVGRSTAVTSTDEPHRRTGNPLTVGSGDRASEPVLDVLTKPIPRRELRRLGAAGLQLRLPLRERRPIIEPAATRGGVAAQLT